jgi:hypothetical protein
MFPSEFNYLLCFQGARSEEFKGFETGSMATQTRNDYFQGCNIIKLSVTVTPGNYGAKMVSFGIIGHQMHN